jgi:hypothetical protein
VHTRPNRSRSGSTLSPVMRARLRPLRYWGPILLGFVLLVVAHSASPVVAYVLVIAAFVLVFEGGTAMFARAGTTGGLKDFHQ